MRIIREPAVAGFFYYLDREMLRKQIEGFFSEAKKRITPKYKFVISPHAGYEYSGQTAAYALASLMDSDKFIILGPNHTGLGSEFSIISNGFWKTPLGSVKIASKIAEKIKECDLITEDDLSHLKEHSIEVQLPFLQIRFSNFEFVPLCIMADLSEGFLKECETIGKYLAGVLKEFPEIRIVISSDFSHFIPASEAEKIDLEAIEKIKEIDPLGFFNFIRKTHASICGYGPILIGLFTAKFLKLSHAELIHYTNSGEVTGDYSSVVGYAAIGFL